jgi:TorA maturation chaperone TorD
VSVAASEDRVVGALRRAAMYRLLAAALAYPLPERVGEIGRLARTIRETWREPGVADALAGFARAAAGAGDTLADEHVRLFDREVRCPPYEGAYGDPQPAGKAAQLADIAGFYAAFGLAPALSQPDTEDHIGAELEFMGALALKEAWALARDAAEPRVVTREAARLFATDHLGRWGEAFAARLGGTASEPYYRSLAALLAAWLAADLAALGVVPARVGDVPAAAEAAPFTCPMAAD